MKNIPFSECKKCQSRHNAHKDILTLSVCACLNTHAVFCVMELPDPDEPKIVEQ